MKTCTAIILTLTLLACTSPQRPFQFSSQSHKSQAMPNLRAALAEQGLETGYIDEEAGIIRTTWQDTGFMFGTVQGRTATIVRRYTVIVVQQNTGLSLTLRADTKRCAQGGFEFFGEMVTGACEGMTQLVGPHQEELDNLGRGLQSRI